MDAWLDRPWREGTFVGVVMLTAFAISAMSHDSSSETVERVLFGYALARGVAVPIARWRGQIVG